jgi:hypothetical protein
VTALPITERPHRLVVVGHHDLQFARVVLRQQRWVSPHLKQGLHRPTLGAFIVFPCRLVQCPSSSSCQLSEWGLAQVNPTATETAYLKCLVAYTTSNDMDWAIWALQGSYYVRNGHSNISENFGLLKPDWSDWQNSTFSGALGNMWKQTQGP